MPFRSPSFVAICHYYFGPDLPVNLDPEVLSCTYEIFLGLSPLSVSSLGGPVRPDPVGPCHASKMMADLSTLSHWLRDDPVRSKGLKGNCLLC